MAISEEKVVKLREALIEILNKNYLFWSKLKREMEGGGQSAEKDKAADPHPSKKASALAVGFIVLAFFLLLMIIGVITVSVTIITPP